MVPNVTDRYKTTGVVRRRFGLLRRALVGFDLLAGGLALETQCGHRAGQQALEPDRFRALLALVERPGLEAPHRFLDLGQEEGLAVVEAELRRVDLLLGRF